jgi:hypothetical protein
VPGHKPASECKPSTSVPSDLSGPGVAGHKTAATPAKGISQSNEKAQNRGRCALGGNKVQNYGLCGLEKGEAWPR